MKRSCTFQLFGRVTAFGNEIRKGRGKKRKESSQQKRRESQEERHTHTHTRIRPIPQGEYHLLHHPASPVLSPSASLFFSSGSISSVGKSGNPFLPQSTQTVHSPNKRTEVKEETITSTPPSAITTRNTFIKQWREIY